LKTDAMMLQVVQKKPFNAEAPLEVLTSIPTPTPLFYVRSNFDIPQIDRNTWRLRVTGAVETEREFRFDDLAQFTPADALVLLECAGNGRKRMVPVPSGVAWDVGAVSCAHFSGVALADVLDACGASRNAVEVLCVGADSGEVSAGRTVAFERSLPLEKALDGSVLLASEMNDEPLTREHGYPLRVLVPQWYAVSSVKWLTEIRVLTEPFSGHFQTERYVYIDDPIAAPHEPVREMRVRALIASPSDRAVLHGMQQVVRGIAWSGAAPVVRVEVSTDGGSAWHDAARDEPASAAAPVAWKYEWNPAPGRFRILARATDAAGNTQPLEPLYNRLGYGNNVVHAVDVTVEPGLPRPAAIR
jgi:DMSO/TMAO reductase YedYZ molybdopterin-dependent catalytic subunit